MPETETSGALSIVATIAPASPVGMALGGAALAPEKSENFSAGLVFGRDKTVLSFDCFRIKVRDRLALSRDIELNRPDLGGNRVRDDLIGQLEAAGLTSARSWNYINYFTNDFSTVTRGCEFAGGPDPGNGGRRHRPGTFRSVPLTRKSQNSHAAAPWTTPARYATTSRDCRIPATS